MALKAQGFYRDALQQVVSFPLVLGWRATAWGCGAADDMVYVHHNELLQG